MHPNAPPSQPVLIRIIYPPQGYNPRPLRRQAQPLSHLSSHKAIDRLDSTTLRRSQTAHSYSTPLVQPPLWPAGVTLVEPVFGKHVSLQHAAKQRSDSASQTTLESFHIALVGCRQLPVWNHASVCYTFEPLFVKQFVFLLSPFCM